MDLTKDIIYERFENIKLKQADYSNFEFNNLLQLLRDSEVLISITNYKMLFVKNKYGRTGELGSVDLLELLMKMLIDSMSCDVKLFKESFLQELNKAVSNVLKTHGICIDRIRKDSSDENHCDW